jgi:protein phosphatase
VTRHCPPRSRLSEKAVTVSVRPPLVVNTSTSTRSCEPDDCGGRRKAGMKITIPELSLVALIGPTGSGKSTFARTHFKPTEIVSSDYCRGLVSDDENSPAATNDAFDVLYLIARKRLAAGKLTVVDATNVQAEARKPIVALAREYHCLQVAIVLNLPEKLCHERNHNGPDRAFGPHVARQPTSHCPRVVVSTKATSANVLITRPPQAP